MESTGRVRQTRGDPEEAKEPRGERRSRGLYNMYVCIQMHVYTYTYISIYIYIYIYGCLYKTSLLIDFIDFPITKREVRLIKHSFTFHKY
jgi:hypothetical protein